MRIMEVGTKSTRVIPYYQDSRRSFTMRYMGQRSYQWIWGVFIFGFVLFSLAPTFYELSTAGFLHPERKFELVHNFPTDYNFYLSRIREGLEGRWTVVEKYTSEPHAGSLIHELYLLMGRVGRMVRVPYGRAGDVYHVARVVLAVTLLTLIAEFCKKASGVSRAPSFSFLAFLLAVTAASFPILTSVDGIPRFGGYMPWWSVMDSLQRITFLPHLLAGQSLMLFLVLALSDRETMSKRTNVVILGIVAFVLGMIFPPGLIFLYGVIGIIGCIQDLWDRKIHWSMWLTWGSVVLISSAALLYLALMTSVYPWKRLTELDIIHPLPFDYWEYVKAVGVMGPLGLMGLIVAFVRKEKLLIPTMAWVIAWGVFLVLFHFVPQQSPLRFSEMIPHVPLGILTCYLFYKAYAANSLRMYRPILAYVPVVLVLLGFGQMYSSYLWQKDFVDHKVVATLPLVPIGSYVMYPLNDFYTAMLFIEDSTPRDAIILSETTAGNYLPVYSGNTVYVGHDNTVSAERKRGEVNTFYSGQMTISAARAFLAAHRIEMIYFGPQEREDAGGKELTAFYPFLTEGYRNSFVTVYRVAP